MNVAVINLTSKQEVTITSFISTWNYVYVSSAIKNI